MMGRVGPADRFPDGNRRHDRCHNYDDGPGRTTHRFHPSGQGDEFSEKCAVLRRARTVDAPSLTRVRRPWHERLALRPRTVDVDGRVLFQPGIERKPGCDPA
jgi:hypothetical protein